MTTPIYDFLMRYSKGDIARLHMPGHKGISFLGCESLDITEVEGADSLYHADGIIKESEQNASSLFGTPTFYSTEGASHTIRAMLSLFLTYTKENGKEPKILAARNVHKSFLSAAALLDIDVSFMSFESEDSYLSMSITPDGLDAALSMGEYSAVYLTSPDYLGCVSDISALSEVCHKHSALLLVDNAHGAYLKFLPKSEHPSDLGADMVCDSAHKTLPTLTGGAYLHLSERMYSQIERHVKDALMLFGSTSPSYLILASLDLTNKYLAEYKARLSDFILRVDSLKADLISHGYRLVGNERLKITISAKEYGYLGTEISAILQRKKIYTEFSDSEYLVLMLTPELSPKVLSRLKDALLSVERRTEILTRPPCIKAPKRVMSLREAVFARSEISKTEDSVGKVVSSLSVACPPAVPIVMSGELIDEDIKNALLYYGIKEISIVV